MNNKKLKLQDDQYLFPYHYVPDNDNGNFTQTFCYYNGFRYVRSLHFIIELIKELNFESLCDVGTGDGRLVREVSKKFPEKKITGIDYSERAINMASLLNHGLDFRVLDIMKESDIPKFDVLTLIEVFEHIPLDACNDFALKIASMLNLGGHLILTVPHQNVPRIDKHFQHFTIDSVYKYFSEYFSLEKSYAIEKRSKIERYLGRLIANKYFFLNHQPFLNKLYKFYSGKYFIASESDCGRVVLVLKKR
jgi:hypothetical protein